MHEDAYTRFRPALLRLDRRPTPLAAIVAALLPLAGMLLLGWPVATMMGLYWIESVAIGVFHFVRMLSARGTPIDTELEGALARNTALTPDQRAQQLQTSLKIQHAVMPGFFLVHYGLFCLVHLGVIAFVFEGAFDDLTSWLGLATIGLIVAQQLVDTRRFRRDAESVALPRGVLMLQPYKRVFVMQFVLILGALPTLFGYPLLAALLLTAIKLLIEASGSLSLASIFEPRAKT